MEQESEAREGGIPGPGETGIPEAGETDIPEAEEIAAPHTAGTGRHGAGRGQWWRRPLVVSVAALTTIAVATLAAIVQSPSAKAGAGVRSAPSPTTTTTGSGSGSGSAAPTSVPANPAPTTPVPTTTSPEPSSKPTATATRRSRKQTVGRAVAALPGAGTGDIAVGVAEVDGDDSATYDSDAGDDLFDTASIVKVDILSALLLNDQRKGTSLTAEQRRLATAMIEQSDNNAALALWHTIGGAPGLNEANARLGLRHTSGGPGELWGLTQTTASDQLVLLQAMFGTKSPLSAASRSYLKGLMGSVTAGQRWGVSAADSGTGSGNYALKNGWLRRTATGLWDINTIGEVTYDGHRLLICVLSSGQRSEAAGIDLVENAAAAAAKAFTGIASTG